MDRMILDTLIVAATGVARERTVLTTDKKGFTGAQGVTGAPSV
jgi:hypothetical protein